MDYRVIPVIARSPVLVIASAAWQSMAMTKEWIATSLRASR